MTFPNWQNPAFSMTQLKSQLLCETSLKPVAKLLLQPSHLFSWATGIVIYLISLLV